MKKYTVQKIRSILVVFLLFLLILSEPVYSQRVTSGLQALYTFLENGGTTVTDVSGVVPQLNLTINTPGAVTWTPDGLIVNSSASIISAAAAGKIYNASTASNEVTIETWIIPASTTYPQSAIPSRIVSMSNGPFERNFTLGQGVGFTTDLYNIRLRTTTTGTNGLSPSTSSASGSVTLSPTHVVYTFKAGTANIYINNVLVQSQFIGGDLSNWDPTFNLLIANETTLDRAWLGKYNLVAIYGIALDSSQVNQNFVAGAPPFDLEITQQPVDQTIFEGQSAEFNIAASGPGPLTYQWQKNGVDLGGETSDTLTIISASLVDSGSAYRCIVTDALNNKDTSNAAILNVNPSPVITQNPTDKTLWEGQTAVFKTAAAGFAPFTYQWIKNNSDSVGTADSLIVGPVTPADSGSTYFCMVTDSIGNKDTSLTAILHIDKSPIITQHPLDKTVFEGDSVEFFISVIGAAPFSFQWQKNGVDIAPPQNNDTLIVASPVYADSGAVFTCIVTDSVGNKDTSNAGILNVKKSPQITSQPTDQIVSIGQPATFSVEAIGLPVLTYQWKKNGSIIPSATDSSYTTPASVLADSGDVYTCEVQDGDGKTETSIGAVLHVVGTSWTGLIEVESNGAVNTDTLKIGQSPAASDSIDAGLGEEELPPPPPTDIFNARLLLPDMATQTEYDFRNSTLNQIQWRLTVQPGLAGWPVEIRWYPSQFPEGRFTLKDPITGFLIRVDMKTDSVYSYTNPGFPFLIIEYRNEICLDVMVYTGWNLIGVPLNAEFMQKDSLFENNTADAFAYNGGYVSKDTLENAKGYWMKFAAGDTVNICGTVLNDKTVPVVSGWNLISGFDDVVSVASITTNPPGILSSSIFFGFSNIYVIVDSLKPGYGYWVKADNPGVINLNVPVVPKTGPQFAKPSIKSDDNYGRIIIEDVKGNQKVLYIAQDEKNNQSFELPPLPPEGIFDVRYSDNREIIRHDEIGSLIVNSAEYPITIRAEKVSVLIQDKIDGSFINKIIDENSKLVVTNKLMKQFRVAQVEIPIEYELSQNYPNPFNPSTTIKFSIPQASRVELYVYNLLGEKVRELINTDMDAGYHEVEFNAAEYASGVYFYKINSGSFSEVKKMMLIK